MNIKSVHLIIFSLFVFSCGPRISHQEEVAYYVTMQKTRNQQIKSWNVAMNASNDSYALSTWNNEGTITPGRADSNENCIKAHVAKIDSSIGIISSLKELDKKINLKNTMLDYLNHSKTLWQDGMMTKIKMMRKGLKNMTDDEQVAYESVNGDVDKIRGEMDGLDYFIQDFAIKHKVTTTELVNFNMK
jgi:hypothetical protein